MKELPLPDTLHGASSGRETPHPQSPLYLLSKSPVDKPSSRFPKRGPYGRRCPSPEPFSTYPTGSPSREPSFQVPLTELPQTVRPSTPRAPVNHISKSPVKEPTPGGPTEPHEEEAHTQSLPFITFRAPGEGAPPPGSPKRAPIERVAPFSEPLFLYLHLSGFCPAVPP